MKCVICRTHEASVGLLCEACAEELATDVIVAPQQIQPHAAAAGPAALVDVWGNAYHLAPGTMLGRGADVQLTILEPSVSQRHAEILRDSKTWLVRDLGSTWGTYVGERRVERPTALAHGDRLRLAHVAFYFVLDLPPLPAAQRFDAPTYRAPPRPTAKPGRRPSVAMTLSEASGGGGILVIDGKQVSLTGAQFELITLLVRRMIEDEALPDDQRGFVSASELAKLSLDSPVPGGDHVRQLVRRVRHALVKAEIGDLIESRRYVGYRLRVFPVLATRPHR